MVPTYLINEPKKGAKPVMPKDAFCYMVGKNGIYKKIRNEYYEATVKIEGVKHLFELEETASLFVEKIPRVLFDKVECFFEAVYEEHKAEVAVILFYKPETKEWGVQVPKQEVTAAHVDYDLDKMEPPEGFELHHRFGSIHSHANMSAFFSSTDDKDDSTFCGAHLVIGSFNAHKHDYKCRWMLAGAPFKAEMSTMVEGGRTEEADPLWMGRVTKKLYTATTYSHKTQIGAHVSVPAGASVASSSVIAKGDVAGAAAKAKEKEIEKVIGQGNSLSNGANASEPRPQITQHTPSGLNRITYEEGDEDYPIGIEEHPDAREQVEDAIKDGKLSQAEADDLCEELAGFSVTTWPPSD